MAKSKSEKEEFRKEYLAEKMKRMKHRKSVRKDKRKFNKRYNHSTRTWQDENGRWMQNCDYFGICEFPCNGDC